MAPLVGMLVTSALNAEVTSLLYTLQEPVPVVPTPSEHAVCPTPALQSNVAEEPFRVLPGAGAVSAGAVRVPSVQV